MAMTNIKEKNKKRETISFKEQQINVGLDVHKKNWNVSIYVGQQNNCLMRNGIVCKSRSRMSK